ncbi:hypothetical protein HNS38_05010 [Lentimicrobium sp. L6]|uniref:hypothetical protein n=1 Tax=Lentimicrobium sp. L6 TaxID=2735916 RepID=UPI0015532D28|nr:hypothetical protein [Lentimicrobium sp. L6]NPD84106.1 hypothetical protein [Lentimicrobium sp. L6]
MAKIIKYNNKLINYQEPITIKDRLIISLEYWWLELDENNSPTRELGFNDEHQVQIAAPKEEDFGMWCNPEIQFESTVDFETISIEDFENKWDEFMKE